MLFNSLSFLIFFPLVVVAYYLLPHKFRWILLLAASSYFYMAFVPAYILILLYLIVIDFILGIVIERSVGKKRKMFLILSVIANVGTLFVFKYFNFVNDNIGHLANALHWNYSIQALRIILPLGLSFHTFQSLSYIIEVYRGKFPAEKHFGIYALYVMFFPQLVAGPIERPQELLSQLHATHEFKETAVSDGLKLMLWGFFKKIVVGDRIAKLVDAIYANPHGANGATLATGAVLFAIQLYADFSGYTDIARGSAEVLGIRLVPNFDLPYFSRSVAEFWRRWHISLSNWFRDYFYLPLAFALGRSMHSRVGPMLALFTTFAVIGLWHGAGWTYVIFGILQAVYMAVGTVTKPFRERVVRAIGLSRFPTLHACIQTIITFALVVLSLIFFRASALSDALSIIDHLGSGWSGVFHGAFLSELHLNLSPALQATLVPFIILMLGGELLERRKHILARLATQPRVIRWSAYYAIIILIIVFSYHKPRTFIYFQF